MTDRRTGNNRFVLQSFSPQRKNFYNMNYTIILESFLRSSLIVILATFAGMTIVRFFKSSQKKNSLLFQMLFLIFFFIPPIALGYGYSYFTFLYIQNSYICNFIYIVVMVCRLAPIAILILFFMPPTLSQSAIHCFKISIKTEHRIVKLYKIIKFSIYTNGKPYIAVLSLLMIMSFSEFELASIMNIQSWSVKVFDAHAHGLPIIKSINLSIIPLIIDLILIIIFLFITQQSYAKNSFKNESNINCSKVERIFAIVLIIFGTSIIIILPGIMILRYAIPGIPILFNEFWMVKETINSALFAIIATIIAWVLSKILIKLITIKKYYYIFLPVIAPGLLGPLSLGLIILALIQVKQLQSISNTPIPLIAALALFLLPFTFIVMILLHNIIPDEALKLARISTRQFKNKISDNLLWELIYQKDFWLFSLIFCKAFFDLTLSAILAPNGSPTISNRLYNLMHYGESEKLSATVCITILLPIFAIIVIRICLKTILPRLMRRGGKF